jgi:hypothetical protein
MNVMKQHKAVRRMALSVVALHVAAKQIDYYITKYAAKPMEQLQNLITQYALGLKRLEQEEEEEEEEEEDSDEERAFRSTREWQLRTTLSFITRDAHLSNAALDDRTLHRALNHGPIPSPLLSSPFLSSDLLPPCRCAQPRSARRDARLHGGHEVPSRLTLCTPSNALFSPDGAILCVLQVRGRL